MEVKENPILKFVLLAKIVSSQVYTKVPIVVCKPTPAFTFIFAENLSTGLTHLGGRVGRGTEERVEKGCVTRKE